MSYKRTDAEETLRDEIIRQAVRNRLMKVDANRDLTFAVDALILLKVTDEEPEQ